MGRVLCAKMKELLARQQADVAVQAAANNRIVARETIKACKPNLCVFSMALYCCWLQQETSASSAVLVLPYAVHDRGLAIRLCPIASRCVYWAMYNQG